jgi:hypothetical protein
LDALLDILAGAAFRETGKSPSIDALEKARPEYLKGYLASLRCAKRAILQEKLTVRQLTTLMPVNDDQDVLKWCNEQEVQNAPCENDTLGIIEKIRPPGWIVVKIDDAHSWFESMGIPAPEWLSAQTGQARDGHAASPAEETEGPPPLREIPEERRERIYRQYLKLTADGTPKAVSLLARQEKISRRRVYQLIEKEVSPKNWKK